MGAMQTSKGKEGERELARLLREHLGATVVRNLAQARQGGAGVELEWDKTPFDFVSEGHGLRDDVSRA